MKPQKNKSFKDESQSLSRQISRSAGRLDQRKRRVTALGFLLGSHIRSGCTSPGGLLIAGCAGFLGAEWIHRPVKKPLPALEQSSKSPDPDSERSNTAAMSNAVLLVKFVQDLMKLWSEANAASGVRQRTDERSSREHAVNEPGC